MEEASLFCRSWKLWGFDGIAKHFMHVQGETFLDAITECPFPHLAPICTGPFAARLSDDPLESCNALGLRPFDPPLC